MVVVEAAEMVRLELPEPLVPQELQEQADILV
jgi:hypothetical protein